MQKGGGEGCAHTRVVVVGGERSDGGYRLLLHHHQRGRRGAGLLLDQNAAFAALAPPPFPGARDRDSRGKREEEEEEEEAVLFRSLGPHAFALLLLLPLHGEVEEVEVVVRHGKGERLSEEEAPGSPPFLSLSLSSLFPPINIIFVSAVARPKKKEIVGL